MTDARQQRLDRLTRRWRERHDAQRPAEADRPPADRDRAERAERAFPYRDVDPAAYAARHGQEMIGFTYDEYRYADPELDLWLRELGEILRRRRALPDG